MDDNNDDDEDVGDDEELLPPIFFEPATPKLGRPTSRMCAYNLTRFARPTLASCGATASFLLPSASPADPQAVAAMRASRCSRCFVRRRVPFNERFFAAVEELAGMALAVAV